MKHIIPHTIAEDGTYLYSADQVAELISGLQHQVGPSTAWMNVYEDISKGGEWLGAARSWMQSNVQNGDRLTWDSGTPVHIPFFKLEDLARKAAFAAVLHERTRVNNILKAVQ